MNIDNIRSFLELILPIVKVKFKELVLGPQYLGEVEYYRKLNYNQKVFPVTQFEKLEFEKINYLKLKY